MCLLGETFSHSSLQFSSQAASIVLSVKWCKWSPHPLCRVLTRQRVSVCSNHQVHDISLDSHQLVLDQFLLHVFVSVCDLWHAGKLCKQWQMASRQLHAEVRFAKPLVLSDTPPHDTVATITVTTITVTTSISPVACMRGHQCKQKAPTFLPNNTKKVSSTRYTHKPNIVCCA